MSTWPRCDMQGCRASAVGRWHLPNGSRVIPMCIDHRDEIEDQLTEHPLEGWESFTPSAVEIATTARLQRMAAGYFG